LCGRAAAPKSGQIARRPPLAALATQERPSWHRSERFWALHSGAVSAVGPGASAECGILIMPICAPAGLIGRERAGRSGFCCGLQNCRLNPGRRCWCDCGEVTGGVGDGSWAVVAVWRWRWVPRGCLRLLCRVLAGGRVAGGVEVDDLPAGR